MAESLNMNGLSLKDSQHADPQGGQPNGFSGERSAYIPPHMRQRASQAPPQAAAPNGYDGGPAPAPGPGPMANGLNGSAWAPQK